MPVPVSNSALTASIEDTTAKLIQFDTQGDPLEPGQCEKLAELIRAAQKVYADKCPLL